MSRQMLTPLGYSCIKLWSYHLFQILTRAVFVCLFVYLLVLHSYLILLFVFLTNNYQTFYFTTVCFGHRHTYCPKLSPAYSNIVIQPDFCPFFQQYKPTCVPPWSNSFQNITKEPPHILVLTGLPWKYYIRKKLCTQYTSCSHISWGSCVVIWLKLWDQILSEFRIISNLVLSR